MYSLPSSPQPFKSLIKSSLRLYSHAFTRLLWPTLILFLFMLPISADNMHLTVQHLAKLTHLRPWLWVSCISILHSLLCVFVFSIIIKKVDAAAHHRVFLFKSIFSKTGLIVAYWIIFGLAMFLGTILLVLPAIYLSNILILGFFVLLLENGSLGNTIRQAFHLIKGYWWHVFGLVLGYMILVFIGILILEGIVLMLKINMLILVLYFFNTAFWVPPFFCLMYLVYQNLKLIQTEKQLKGDLP